MPNPVETLLKNIRTIIRLKEYVFTGEIIDVITDAELAAAREAFEKTKTASDKRAQVWSAINHLEAAHHRLKPIYYGKTSYSAGTILYRIRMMYKDQYTLCLMAVGYVAVGEQELCRRALAESKDAPKHHDYMWHKAAFMLFLTPNMLPEYAIAIKNLVTGESIPEEGIDVGPFEAALL
jgi:hypothetical protein